MTPSSIANPERPGRSATAGRRRRCAWALAVTLGLGGVTARAMPGAPAGIVETGAPSFVVLGPEALGLSTPPIDLHLLPDGRTLVVSQRELALGDGVRWETFRGPENEPAILTSVVIDHGGQIYISMGGGFARIELGEDSRWHANPVMKMPGASVRNASLVSVVEFADHWYWYDSNGAVVSWRPGQIPRLAANVGAIDQIFALGGDVYIGDESAGRLFRWKADGAVEQVRSVDAVVSESVTCAIPFGSGQLLVGTVSAGLKLFDGKTFRPFGPPGLLNNGQRIADLCPTGEGFFAASIDTVGIVFFDREGRIVQVLDRSLDHRLGRPRRLQYASDGVLWALLNEGVARVEFPSPISHFEPLLASGLVYAQPLRHAGQLWILTDGRVMHGAYDASGRLERFVDETPPGRYVFTVADVDGRLFAANEVGIFVYEQTGWRLILPGIVNARLGLAPSTAEGVFYAAVGEYGTIRQTGENYVARRIPVSDLGENYNPVVDSAGIGWFELGMNRVGRLDPNAGNPVLQILGTKDGLAEGWIEVYLLDGIARFHVGNQLFRFDDGQRKFVADLELLARIPQLAAAGGRPVTDRAGRLWFTANGATQVIDRSATGGNRPVKTAPVGFAPVNYTLEDDGVVWMFERRRLARMDLRLPRAPERPLRALITSVQFSASSRRLFAPGPALRPLDYADNSLVIHFVAPANPFASPVTFEVLLEGAGTQWLSTGAVGSATFNRLKEGDYAFRVRPVAGGAAPGAEARLQFAVRPPWFRTPLAWGLYVAAAAGLFAFAAWLSSYLQRRENERLERVVAERTGELNATNTRLGRQIGETTEKSAALSVSEERYRSLNAGLEDRVQQRTAELSLSNAELLQRESLFRLIFEHAPLGISWKRSDLGDGYHVNSTFRRILALPADTLTDYSHLATLVHPDDAPRQIEMNRLIGSGRIDSYNLEERFVLPDGRLVWSALSVAVIRDRVGRIVQEIGILEDITARKRAEEELAATHKNLLTTSRQAGMAEVATGVLHNVGNVLNSVNVSATLVADQLRRSQGASLAKLVALLAEHRSDLASFFTHDARGQMIPGYLGTLADSLAAEQATMLAEVAHLRENIEHIKNIVAMQQNFARNSGFIENVALTDLVEDALQMNVSSLTRHDVTLVRDFQIRPTLSTDKHKVVQILLNLVRNAQHACDETGRPDKRIGVRIAGDAQRVLVSVSDNGTGIAAENLARVFSHGYTTKKTGHGFGLHSGALAAKELGGSLSVASDGPGLGATFVLELPLHAEKPASEGASPHATTHREKK